MAKVEIADIVLEQIQKQLAAIESGEMVWDNGRTNAFRPYNPVSKAAYRGINVFNLGLATLANGWAHPHFMTYNQAAGLGAWVKKGAKSEVAVFWKMNRFNDKKDQNKIVTIPLLRFYRVFNIADIENLPEQYAKPATGPAELLSEPEAVVTAFLKRENVDIVPTFASPYYSAIKDVIGMPPLADYKTSSRYYESLMHEMVHATGHKSRLNRFTEENFIRGEAYSREELIAEFGSAMLLVQTGTLEGYKNLAAYIKSWWSVTGNNPKELIVAAGKADKAVAYVNEGKASLEEAA
jgi:antirestriction protein ArdC